MTASLAVATTAICWVLCWILAKRTATERHLDIGRFPTAWLFVTAFGAYVAATAQHQPLAATTILAGVAIAGTVDARTGFIFNRLTVAITAFAIATSAAGDSVLYGLAGAIAVGGSLLALYALTRGAGIGLGDVKLGIGVGVALGAGRGLDAIGFAFVFGAAYALSLLCRRRAGPGTAVRFGPFIAAGTFMAVLAPAGWLP